MFIKQPEMQQPVFECTTARIACARSVCDSKASCLTPTTFGHNIAFHLYFGQNRPTMQRGTPCDSSSTCFSILRCCLISACLLAAKVAADTENTAKCARSFSRNFDVLTGCFYASYIQPLTFIARSARLRVRNLIVAS